MSRPITRASPPGSERLDAVRRRARARRSLRRGDRTHHCGQRLGCRPRVALTAGFQRAFLIGALVVLAAALVALLAGKRRAGAKAGASRLVPATNDLSVR